MDVFLFDEGERVLFLGEGNFSFSSELVRTLKNAGFEDFSSLYSTCLEDEDNSGITTENKDFLKSQGVRVLYGVDATKLSENVLLQNGRFDRVVFNFPHVGGKMRIHLNRLLLKEFFISASGGNVLSPNGKVLMSLCSGQGGTGAEKRQRRWDDTWQVAEMAAFGDFLLKRVVDFPHRLFPSYVSTGFRSTVRSFHTEGSLVHVFQKCGKPFPSEMDSKQLNSLHDFHFINGVQVTLEYKNAICNNPLEIPTSPQFYLCSLIITAAENVNKITSDLPLFTKLDNSNLRPICIYEQKQVFLRNSLFEVVQDEEMIAKGLIFNKITDMSSSVAECELLIKCIKLETIIQSSASKIAEQFSTNQEDIIAFFTHHASDCASVNVDKLCSFLFQVDNRELWSGSFNGTFVPCSVYPKKYEFDVSFGAPCPFDEAAFCALLTRLPGGVIAGVRQISVFCPEDIQLTYFCYRITYVSYQYPLHRSRTVDYHTKIVCRALEKIFKVNIR